MRDLIVIQAVYLAAVVTAICAAAPVLNWAEGSETGTTLALLWFVACGVICLWGAHRTITRYRLERHRANSVGRSQNS